MSLITGGGISDNIFKDLAQLQLAEVPNGRRVELITGERYCTGATDAGEGLLLAGGNYANRVTSGLDVIRYNALGNPIVDVLRKNKPVETLDGGIANARASNTSYVDRYGIVRYAATNELREGRDGFLIEALRTNSILESNVFTPYVNDPIVEADTTEVVAPDLSNTASKVSAGSASSPLIRSITTHGLQVGDMMIYSLFVKYGSAETITLNCYTAGGAENNTTYNFITGVVTGDAGGVEQLSDGWARVWQEVPITTTDEIRARVWVIGRDVIDQGAYTYLWEQQVEDGNFPTSLIKTTGTKTTRLEDDITAQAINNIPNTADDFTIVFHSKLMGRQNPNGLQVAFSFDGFSYYQHNGFIGSDGSTWEIYGAQNKLPRSSSDDERVALVVNAKDSTQTLYVNGELIGVTYEAAQQIIPTYFSLGSANGGSTLNGNLLDFKLYDFALNDTEAKLVTRG